MRIVLLAIVVVSSGCGGGLCFEGGSMIKCTTLDAHRAAEDARLAAEKAKADEAARLWAAEQLKRKAWCVWATQDATSTATPEQRQGCYAAMLAEQAQERAAQQQNTEAQLQIQRQALQDARDAEERRRKAQIWRDVGQSFQQPKSVTTTCSEPDSFGRTHCTTD